MLDDEAMLAAEGVYESKSQYRLGQQNGCSPYGEASCGSILQQNVKSVKNFGDTDLN